MASARIRRPGDAIRLIACGVLLVLAFVVIALAPDRLVGTEAAAVLRFGPATTTGRLLVGLSQVFVVVSAAAATVVTLRLQRYRLLATLAGAAVVAWLVVQGIELLVDRSAPPRVVANRAAGGWILRAGFPGAAALAGAAAAIVAGSPWLGRRWRPAAWLAFAVVAAAGIVAGVILPAALVLAVLVGATVGHASRIVLRVPDGRVTTAGIAAALTAWGLPVDRVDPASVPAKGSRPFVATTTDGTRLFVKVLGREERDADLLYRLYRFLRLRHVGDMRPAASLKQSVEHQALIGLLAERAGVTTPSVRAAVEADDGSMLLVLEYIDGDALDAVDAQRLTDEVLGGVWQQAARLHAARIAHRSLRAANIMVDHTGAPHLVDFSFAELTSDPRPIELDRAELLASLAVLVGPERAVASAMNSVGPEAVASAVPLLQPLALSAGTRRDGAGKGDLLKRTREAAAAAAGGSVGPLTPLHRVRARTVLTVVLGAGAFYFILPQLAQVGSSWRAFRSARWSWTPLIVAMSALTYVASAVGMMGTVRDRLPIGPTLLTQLASSFVNRVSPANVGGMAANARFLQNCGVGAAPAVAAVGLNSLVGGIVHIVLIVVFFAWSGSSLGKAFSLPSGGKVLLVVAVAAALSGAVFLTAWGRRRLGRPLVKGLRSSAVNLRAVATSPPRLAALVGGSMGVTLAYIGAVTVSVQAFGGGISIARLGAVYLGASALAAAAPTPGNLGAIEAALVAGLTGVGMEPGAAVSTVLVYRLATYWLPIPPGWLAWRWLQRREYL